MYLAGPNEIEPLTPLKYHVRWRHSAFFETWTGIEVDSSVHVLIETDGTDCARVPYAARPEQCDHEHLVCKDCLDTLTAPHVVFTHTRRTYDAWREHYKRHPRNIIND